MIKSPEPNIKDIAEDILRYLHARENAADTLEGITQWWIPHQRIAESKRQVKVALDYLCKEELTKATTLVGGRTLYSLNKEKIVKPE